MDRHQVHVQHPQHQSHYEGGRGTGTMKDHLPSSGPTTSQVLAVVTLLPITGTLLGLAGIILAGTLIALAVATPLFVIFSPILVPAAILLAGTVTAFMTSGAFGLTGLSSLSWVLNSFRAREPLDYAKRQMQEAAIAAGEKTKQTGEMIKSKAQGEGREGVRTT